MNYRHIYHAGNFADVFKHWIYCLLLEYTQRKEKPFAVLETHAGLGQYDLNSIEANKTEEYQAGIIQLLKANSIPDSLTPYLEIVKQQNSSEIISQYPGSPTFIKHYLKPQDDLHLCELHPDDFKTLKYNFYHDQNIHCHNTNGYHAMKALLPFTQKRGLIFIDPPFEKADEYQQIMKHLKLALTRFRQGIYSIWFPIKNYKDTQKFYRELEALQDAEIMKVELVIDDLKNPNRMNGCGMIIINPTWGLEDILKRDLKFLLDTFKVSEQAYFKVL